jgi:type IV pilus assembly protein PilM
MAENAAVWGIDIGQAGLKAIRLRYAEAAGQAIAVAFDYVPHPKILSQPDAVPDELIAQALQTFLSRNDTKGDLLCISVPGQSALARFIQLPPVEAKKVVEIVKYEARQQIPFALEDVIWDFQTLGGGSEEGDYLIDAEVGLFAMKREQVHQHLKPFTDAKCEIELIQIAPLALYNFLCYDRMGIRLDKADEDEHGYNIVLDMGADNTMLLVSNGKKIWIRNVPIGGNHFTRALTKEMKLTFAKAEHLKCNATKSPDPKAVFQALRPVFNDYVAEIQRSIGYFSSVNRDAKIQQIIGVGNGFKLAGLQKFLHQNLQYEVERVESFSALVGDAVLNVPLFQENIMSFVVPYGLALQGLKLTRIHTTLLPTEIKTARLIRRKKPWAVAAAATLLVGFSISAFGFARANGTASKERWNKATSAVEKVVTEAASLKSEYDTEEGKNKKARDDGNFLVSQSDGKYDWLEVYQAINACLPRDEGNAQDIEDIQKRNRIRIYSITAKYYPDLGTWYKAQPASAKDWWVEPDKSTAPTGGGYVFKLDGLHYHDDPSVPNGTGLLYVVNTLVKDMREWQVKRADAKAPVPVRKIGITHPTVVYSAPPVRMEFFPHGRPSANAAAGGAVAGRPGFGGRMPMPMPMPGVVPGAGVPRKPRGAGAAAGDPANDRGPIMITQTNFTLEFAWKAVPEDKRTETDPAAPKVAPAATGTPGTPAPPATAAAGSPAGAPAAALPAPATASPIPVGSVPAAPATPAPPPAK